MDEIRTGFRDDHSGEGWPGPADDELIPDEVGDLGDHVRVGLEDLDDADPHAIDGFGDEPGPVTDRI